MHRPLTTILLVTFISVLCRNRLLMQASVVLLGLQLLRLEAVVTFMEEKGLETGLLLLTVAVLAPLASNKAPLESLAGTFLSREGMAALLAGMVAAILTGQGVSLLRSSPGIVIGLALGSILGAAFFRGIPAGPLVAAGLASMLIGLLRRV